MRDRIWIAGLKCLQPSLMTVGHCPSPFPPSQMNSDNADLLIDTPTRRDMPASTSETNK